MVFGAKKKKSPAKKKDASISDNAEVEEANTVVKDVKEKAAEAEEAAATAIIVEGPPAEEFFVDGVSSLFLRSGVVKLECYRVVGHDRQTNRESRMAALRLVLPAPALQELAQLLRNVSDMQRARADKAGT